jgi:cytochrome c-type biogenesis protein CcmH
MRVSLRILIAISLTLLSCYPLLAEKAKPTVDGVASKLSCFCGTCPHLVVTQCGCSTADQIKAEVQKKIDAGMTESQIVDSFVAQYGQTILTTPPKSGFNLTAWGLPFLGFLVGGTLLFAFLKKQQPLPRPKGPSSAPPEQPTDQDYRERIRKELESRR